MISVTQEGGTARRASIEGIRWQENRTSQVYDPKLGRYSKTQYVASFGGFTPAKDPRVSILVLIRNPENPFTEELWLHRFSGRLHEKRC